RPPLPYTTLVRSRGKNDRHRTGASQQGARALLLVPAGRRPGGAPVPLGRARGILLAYELDPAAFGRRAAAASIRRHGSAFWPSRRRSRRVSKPSGRARRSSAQSSGVATAAPVRARSEYGAMKVCP